MIQQFEDLTGLLRQIPKLAVIETSDDSTGSDHSLPAVIIDFEPGTIGPFLEDDTQLYEKSSYSLTIMVPLVPSRKVARKSLNDLTKKIFQKIVAGYGAIEWGTFYPQTVPFGKGDALAYGIQITLPQELFDLEN